MDKAFFCNSGAESNEAAIKLARKHARVKLNVDKPVILTAHSSFHGRTLAAITATGQSKYHQNFDYGGHMVQGFEYVTYNDAADLASKVAEVQSRGDGSGLAAILMEPLQGEGGIHPGSHDFFQAARDLCDETGALLMCDEVQAGMGRTGTLWGYQQLEIEPDVITTAKALGGGVPIGAMLCKDACNVFGPGDHASTYGGNPLACAAALAVASTFEKEQVLDNVKARSEQLLAGLKALQST